MEDRDVEESSLIFRLAFGTYLGVPDPAALWPDRNYVATRHGSECSTGLVAEAGAGGLAGFNMVAVWGSFGCFGPLAVRPEYWGTGVSRALLDATMERFERAGVRETGLYTFANSAKHVRLYQKYGFRPRFLTAVMSKEVAAAPAPPSWTGYSQLGEVARAGAEAACREITCAIFEGLDLTGEIRSVGRQNLGETVLLEDGFAVCHCGPGTEAGAGICYVKFGAVRSGPGARGRFERLLAACESLASERGLTHLEAGVNTARSEAYGRLADSGFRTKLQGVAMQRPDAPGFNRPDVWALDDWR